MILELDKLQTINQNELFLLGGSFCCEGKALVIGVVHGDEPQGEEFIYKYIKETPDTKMLYIPCLNPDGKDLNTRVNANGVDLNRNFPTNNWELSPKDKYYGGMAPASEFETKFLINIVERYKPSLILTIHTPYKVVNYDGDAKDISKKISAITGYPVEESIGYPTPGSFGTWAGVERKIPTITLEIDEDEKFETMFPKMKQIFELLEAY